MTRKDWLCPVCGDVMNILSSKGYMLCLRGHGRLHPVYWHVQNLPQSQKIKGKTYWIASHGNGWEYVPHGHKTALDKAPPEGHVVASVAFRGHRAVRLFRRNRTLRERLTEHHFCKLGEEAGK